jgi:hypothetical protein
MQGDCFSFLNVNVVLGGSIFLIEKLSRELWPSKEKPLFEKKTHSCDQIFTKPRESFYQTPCVPTMVPQTP